MGKQPFIYCRVITVCNKKLVKSFKAGILQNSWVTPNRWRMGFTAALRYMELGISGAVVYPQTSTGARGEQLGPCWRCWTPIWGREPAEITLSSVYVCVCVYLGVRWESLLMGYLWERGFSHEFPYAEHSLVSWLEKKASRAGPRACSPAWITRGGEHCPWRR